MLECEGVLYHQNADKKVGCVIRKYAVHARNMVLYSLVISRSGFEAILMIPGTISLEINYSLKPQIR